MAPMASMMDEMAKTLARRRAQAEGGDKGSTKSAVLNGSSPSKDDSGSRCVLLFSKPIISISLLQVVGESERVFKISSPCCNRQPVCVIIILFGLQKETPS